MIINRTITLSLIAAVSALTIGCGQQVNDAQAQAGTIHEDIQKAQGKPSVPATIAYELMSVPTVGQPLVVRLTIDAAQISDAQLSFSTSGDIALGKTMPVSVAVKSSFAGNTTGLSDRQHDIVVVPASPTTTYLNVQLSGIFEGDPVTKAMSIPIAIGDAGPVLSVNGELLEADGEVLLSMPGKQSQPD